MPDDEPFIAKISAWAFGGAGILRREGLAVFVPFTCPEDIIECRISSKKKSFATGNALNIITPSPQRSTPQCPLFQQCGGCQLQHVSYLEQLAYKRQTVVDALERIGGFKQTIVHETVPADPIWHYRRHIRLHIREGLLGFYKTDNIHLCEPDTCEIFHHDPQLFASIREITPLAPDGTITLIKQSNKFLMEWQSVKTIPEPAIHGIQKLPFLVGGTITSPTQKISFGNTNGTVEYAGKSFVFKLGAFLQNHPGQSAAIYDLILAKAKASSAQTVLDLYSGIGVTACLIADLAEKVDAIECAPAAVASAKINIAKYAPGRCSQHHGAVEKVLPKLKAHYDLALINPPRTGMHSDAIKEILRLKPERLLYLSCMPSTLARDLKILSDSYRIVDCTPFDMFPHTAHVETLVELQRST